MRASSRLMRLKIKYQQNKVEAGRESPHAWHHTDHTMSMSNHAQPRGVVVCCLGPAG